MEKKCVVISVSKNFMSKNANYALQILGNGDKINLTISRDIIDLEKGDVVKISIVKTKGEE